MKPIPIVYLLVVAGTALVLSQDEKTDAVPQVSLSPTTARILGDIPDGTPPTPAPLEPKFIVPAQDVLKTKTHQQGGRTITVRRIAPIALPPQVKAAPPVNINDPAIQGRIAKFIEESPADEFLCAGATVFHPKDSAPLSFVQIWPQGKGESITLWSSADFGLLSGVSSFLGSDGGTRSLMLMWSASETDTRASLQTELGPDAPKIPLLPPGKATFSIISGAPSPQTLTSIQSLHDIYNNEHARLAAAHEGRQRAQLQQEAELKANPPRPKDITLNYWRIAPISQPVEKGATR